MNIPHKEPSLSGDFIEDEGAFFRNHGITIQESLEKEKFQEFCNLICDEERIKFMYDLDIIHNIELPSPLFHKNIEKAKKYKNDGNVLFGKSNYKQAAIYYGFALIECPDSEHEFYSILYANRSAALYHIKEYEICLQDIDMALSFPYPAKLQHKVFERRARCSLALNDLNNAIISFKDCMKALEHSDLNRQNRQKKESDISIMIALLTKSLEKNNKVHNKSSGPKYILPTIPPVSGTVNEKFPSASNLIHFTSSESEGRFAVANENIEPGQVLLTEKANCSVLLFEYSKTHCQNCFVRVSYPIPCIYCPNVVFCTIKCRTQAMNTYHKHECAFSAALWTCGVSIVCFLAVRLITQRGLKYFLDLKPKLSKKISDADVYNSASYKTIYNLCGHPDKRSQTNFFQRTVIATVLLRFLQRSKFFNNEPSRSLSEEEIYIGGLILHNLQVLQFNAHEIAELQFDVDYPGDVQRAKSQFIGGGIFPTLALFNHSCEPGIIRYFSGSSVIVKSIKSIRKNDIVAENYGPIYTEVKREIRQAELKSRYWFDCNCHPCTENWPLFDDMNNSVLSFKCIKIDKCSGVIKIPTNTNEFMFPCPVCKEMICIFGSLKSLNETGEMFTKGDRLMNSQNYGEAGKTFIKILKILSNVLQPPYKDFCLCQQKIRSCMLTFGNVYQPVKN